MQSWDDLKYVLALQEHGSLVKAAKKLKTNPTTVSRHINRLSDSFQKTLFVRKSNGEWFLTEEGQKFARVGLECQSAIESLSDSGPRNEMCEVKLSTTEFIADTILSPKFHTLTEMDDSISITVDTRDDNVSLAYGEADLALRLGRPTSGRLVASKLADINMGIFACGDPHPSDDWIGLPTELDWVPEMQMGLRYFNKPPSIRFGTFSSIRQLAASEHLACIGPDLMMEGWHGLDKLDPSKARSHREVWSVFHETRRNDQGLATVREWVKTCFLPQSHPLKSVAAQNLPPSPLLS